MRNFFVRFAPLLASLALFIGINSVNSPSVAVLHQPQVPNGLEKYRK